jgi:hypothetical protein
VANDFKGFGAEIGRETVGYFESMAGDARPGLACLVEFLEAVLFLVVDICLQ